LRRGQNLRPNWLGRSLCMRMKKNIVGIASLIISYIIFLNLQLAAKEIKKEDNLKIEESHIDDGVTGGCFT